MKAMVVSLGLVIALAAGCNRRGDDLTPPLRTRESRDLIQRIERGEYTTYHSQPHIVLVKEVQELFRYKDAYPWLISALEGKDKQVADTVFYQFTPLDVPGGLTSEGLRRWYSVPENELIWNGYLWKPRLPQ